MAEPALLVVVEESNAEDTRDAVALDEVLLIVEFD